MGWQIVKQKDEKYAVWSSIVDDFIWFDCSEEELVEIFLGDRVVFVIVATGTRERLSHPNGRCRHDPVDDVFRSILFINHAPLDRDRVIAIESGCQTGLVGRAGKHVAGNLLDRELIERHVRIERVNHPVAPNPLFSLAIILVSA